MLLVLYWPSGGHAADYGVFLDIETEEDLLELLESDEIDQTSFDALVELLQDGVDLNQANRQELYILPNLSYAEVDAILAYRKEVGRIPDPAALIAAGILSLRKLQAIAPFLVIRPPPQAGLLGVTGRLRYRTTYVASDDKVPSMWLGAEVSPWPNLDLGLITVLTRTRLGEVAYDPNRDALSAEPTGVQLQLPKIYAQWETDRWHLVAGSYRLGFGQRLTFDNTSYYTPNGIRVDNTIYYSQDVTIACRESAGELDSPSCTPDQLDSYIAPDYRWTDRLLGVAGGAKRLELGSGWLQTYLFGSYQSKGIYQYETYDAGRCADPRNDGDPACGAVPVYIRRDDLLAPTSRAVYSVLPDMFSELTGGGNVSYFFNNRAHLGVTGYGAAINWLPQGIELDFQEWSRLPFGGPFGAVGLDGAWGVGQLDLFFEAARSFDSQPEGGGLAALLRSTVTWKRHELEAVGRYYGQDFANPYARPIAAADELEGLRARDEAGLRLKYSGLVGDLSLRGTMDFWSQLSDDIFKMKLRGRADYELAPWLIPGLWVEFQDRDLSDTGRGNCYEFEVERVAGELVSCRGEKLQVQGQVKLRPLRRMSLTAEYQHRWIDDGSDRFADRFRQDMNARLTALYWPLPELRLRSMFRYRFWGISEESYLEESVWFYLEGLYQVARRYNVKLRYEVYAWIDERRTTQERQPNPAHWLRLELEYRF